SGARDQAPRDLHPRRSCARPPRSAQTAPYLPSCGGLVSWSSSSHLSSNGSRSCSGSQYGSPSGIGLGGWGFGGGLTTSRSIGQPLANNASHRFGGTLRIIDAERSPVAIPKIKLGQIAVQMPLIAMLVNANHAALEDRKITLDRVCVSLSPHVFVFTV